MTHESTSKNAQKLTEGIDFLKRVLIEKIYIPNDPTKWAITITKANLSMEDLSIWNTICENQDIFYPILKSLGGYTETNAMWPEETIFKKL